MFRSAIEIIQSKSFINESQERMTPASEPQSVKNRMACSKRLENRRHQPLGQVRGDGTEHSCAIIHDQSEFTVTRELRKGHGSSDNGVKTRATTVKETARISKEFIIKKSTQEPSKELSRIEEEQNDWANEGLPLMTNTSQMQGEFE